MIKVITIDFWNTIYDSSGREERHSYRIEKVKEATRRFNEFEHHELDRAVINSWKYFESKWLGEKRTPDSIEVCTKLWKDLKLDHHKESIEFIAKEFEESLFVNPPKLTEYFIDVVANLNSKYKLAIISDTGYSPGYILKELKNRDGILNYFDSFSYSNETGVAKPNPDAFYKVLNELDCKPENALHIGDIERTDILGAKSIGMKAIRYEGSPDKLSVNNPIETQADFIAKNWLEIDVYLNTNY